MSPLNGAGVESMSAKWDELFGVKEEVVVEGVKGKKPRKKTTARKPATKKVVKAAQKVPTKKKPVAQKITAKKLSATKTTRSKLKATDEMIVRKSAKK